MATKVPVDALGEDLKGYVIWISGENDKQGFPMKQVSWFLAVFTFYWVRAFLLQTKEHWIKKAHICSGLQCGCKFECSELGHCKKKERWIFLDSLNYCAVSPGSKRASRIWKLFISLKKMTSTKMLWESP